MSIRNLLQKLDVGDENETMLLEKEETGYEVDILTSLITGFGSISNIGQGEFYFYGEDDKPDIFVCRITVVSEILPENVYPICTELAVTNSELPLGRFAYDPDENAIVYSLETILPEDMTEDEILDEADNCIQLSLRLSGGYAAQYAYYAKRR